MSEALFKVGSVYRDQGGNFVRLYQDDKETGLAKCMALDDQGREEGFDGRCNLADGKDVGGDLFDLIPGELHQVNGEWVPITEQPMAPYFAQALEEKPLTVDEIEPILEQLDRLRAANAAMIARDGEAKESHSPTVIASKEEKLASVNVHAPVKGLTFLGSVDHRFGSFRF